MAHTAQRAYIDPERLQAIQTALRERGLDGWLLYDYHATNQIAGRVLGLREPMSRRYFVLIPAHGEPTAVAHSLERPPWSDWHGPVRIYFRWQELQNALADLLPPGKRFALEYSEADRIPQLDRVPAGVVDLIRRSGVELVESSELVTLFAATWSAAELESHRKTSRVLANVAARAYQQAADAVRSGEALSEWGLKQSIQRMFDEAGLVEGDTIVGVGPNAADGHYEPTPQNAAPIVKSQVLLIDLWAKEPGAVFADQTWMGFMDAEVPEKVESIWRTVRAARDAAVRYARDTFSDPNKELRGCDVDAASRAVIEQAGFGGHFNHRTGHSIDNEVHGLGPNIDGVETNDDRILLPGVGFSIEPGIYLENDFGVRSEINVYLGPDGPEVTTPKPQADIYRLLSDEWQSKSNL
jgi:Xaa-Pro dipeptidase